MKIIMIYLLSISLACSSMDIDNTQHKDLAKQIKQSMKDLKSNGFKKMKALVILNSYKSIPLPK